MSGCGSPPRGAATPETLVRAWKEVRREKPAAYGQAGIPLYLLIDRDSCTVTVHSSPDRRVGGYRDVRVAKFGETVALPDPMGIELDTEILNNYVR